jgi:type II secretory pathway pseudopilin PulG
MNRRRIRGFTYLMALFVIAIAGVGLALLGDVWQTAALREQEAELLYVGNQYRRAIELYYLSGPQQYPRTLDDLLKDPRSPTIRRHLRQLYPDPITGTSEWMLVKAPDGGIMGVHSRSEKHPLKIANFKPRDKEFEAAEKYIDWKFVYAPMLQMKPNPAATVAPVPGAAPIPAIDKP